MSGRQQNGGIRGPKLEDIRPELLKSMHLLARDLAPGGTERGGYYFPRNPMRADRHPGSLWIRVSGTGTGAWQDHAVMSKPSDVLSLVHYMACNGNPDGTGGDWRATRKWCLDWLGWNDASKPRLNEAERERRRAHDAQLREVQQKQRKKDQAEKAKKAFGWWLRASDDLTGTPVWAYFRARGVDLAAFEHQPGALRYLPKAEHISDVGEITEWPCLMSAMSAPDGKVSAVHRTWLAEDGSGKAPVDKPKKMWPGFGGCMIRLAKGEGNHSPEEAARKGLSAPLLVTEGQEDGLSIALLKPDLRIWAAGTVSNMGNVPDLPCISRLIIAADNDEKVQAKADFENSLGKLKRRFGARGCPVSVVRAFHGKDANDQLRSG